MLPPRHLTQQFFTVYLSHPSSVWAPVSALPAALVLVRTCISVLMRRRHGHTLQHPLLFTGWCACVCVCAGAALLWTAQGISLSRCAIAEAKRTKEPVDIVTSRFNGYFWTFFQVGVCTHVAMLQGVHRTRGAVSTCTTQTHSKAVWFALSPCCLMCAAQVGLDLGNAETFTFRACMHLNA